MEELITEAVQSKYTKAISSEKVICILLFNAHRQQMLEALRGTESTEIIAICKIKDYYTFRAMAMFQFGYKIRHKEKIGGFFGFFHTHYLIHLQ